MDIETITSPEIKLEIATQETSELIKVFREANDRMHPFLTADQRDYIEMEMRVTIFPIASFILARIDDEVAGFISLMDNYIVGIYIANEYLEHDVEKKLLNAVKKLYGDLEVCVYLKNFSMVKFYLEEGFDQISAKVHSSSSASKLRLAYMLSPVTASYQ